MEHGDVLGRVYRRELPPRQQFVGTPGEVAADFDHYVQSDACDGFIFVPHLTPHGLDEFVDKVVPQLQERGTYRTEYSGRTLRDHLGLVVADADEAQAR